LDAAVAGEPGADAVLSEAYLALTDEVMQRVDELAAKEGRHRG
jgi:hypothetical protein